MRTISIRTKKGTDHVSVKVTDDSGFVREYEDVKDLSCNYTREDFKIVMEHEPEGIRDMVYVHNVDIVEFFGLEAGEDDGEDDEDAEETGDFDYRIVDAAGRGE